MADDKRLTPEEVRNRVVETRRMRLRDILVHDHNWRGHPDNQRRAFRGVVREIGWAGVPMAYPSERNGGRLTYLDGHMRQEELPDFEADVAIADLTDEEADYFLASFDTLGAMIRADRMALATVLENINSADAAVSEMLAGLAEREGVWFGGNGGGPAEDPGPQLDKASELQEKWDVRVGDLWVIESKTAKGEHRVVCGDCTDRAAIERLIDHPVQMLFTSPPYWVGKDYEAQGSLQEVKEFISRVAETMAAITNKDGGRIIINCSTASAKAVNPKADPETIFTLAWWQESLRACDWLMRHCRVWLKHGDMAAPSVAARSDVVDQHWELIPEFLPTFYYPDGLRRGQEKIGMKWAQLGVWSDIPGERSAEGKHCAAFPLQLPERYIQLYSIENEFVGDIFLGSGTTIAACERLGRLGRGVEIEPKYVAVTLERLAQMSLSPRRAE